MQERSQENASWLRRSRRVAYAIMDYMQDNGLSRNDVAEKLGVSPQYVSKILSGKVNFSFKTISEIEEGLGVYSQLCVWCAVLTLPLVNLHVALDGQNTTFGKILCQFQITSNTLSP